MTSVTSTHTHTNKYIYRGLGDCNKLHGYDASMIIQWYMLFLLIASKIVTNFWLSEEKNNVIKQYILDSVDSSR